MPARILIVDRDPTTVTWLKSKLMAEGYAVDTANRGDVALQKISQEAPDLVVLDPALPDGDGLDIIRRIREDPQLADRGAIILSRGTEPDDIMAGLNAGADHFIRKRPGADTELLAKVRARLAQPKKGASAGDRGRIFSFCSAKGGAGTTSVCINTAYALAKLEPRADILVVDLVFPMGSVWPSLGYESRKTIVKLAQEHGDKPDRILTEKYVSQLLKWGFRVMLGANDPQEAGSLDVSRIVPIFETLKTMYDYVLVDFGRTLSRISLPIMENSSAIVIIVTPDVSTVKASKVMVEFLEAHNVDRNRLILINNRTVGRIWTTTEDIERELKLALAGTIPYVVEYMTMAINASVPFMEKFPDHAAGIAFTDLARRIQGRGRAKIS